MADSIPLKNVLPALGLGCAPLGNLYRAIDDDSAVAVVRHALEVGIRLFDVAPRYGFGLAEERLGQALSNTDRSTYILSTKVGRVLEPDPDADVGALREGFVSPNACRERFDYSRDGAMRSIEASLARLKTDRIDIALIHDIGALTHGDAHRDVFRAAMNGAYRALSDLRDAGVVRAIGLGINETQVALDAMAAAPLDCVLLAGRYTLLDRSATDVFLPRCMERDVAVIIGGIFNSGILATGADSPAARYDYASPSRNVVVRTRAIDAACARHGVPLRAAAAQFAARHPAVASTIVGIASQAELDDFLAVRNLLIPGALWDELDALAAGVER